MKFEEIQKKLKKELKPSRYKHTMGVVETAGKLAEIHSYDVGKARLAALLHDCAKEIPDEQKFSMCREYGVSVTDAERANPPLLHAKCGALVAEYKYGIGDEEILHAIRVHTTGCIHMSLLDEIIFVADYIEPGRDQAPHLKKLRKLAQRDLEQTTYRIMADTVCYLQSSPERAQMMDPATYQAYLYYKECCASV